jgi:hypothetical protein
MEKTYTDFRLLVSDIKEYMKANPEAEIISDDDPLRLMIGFCDENTEKLWRINVKDIKNSLINFSENDAEIVHKAFQTQEGKNNLIKSWHKE